MKNLLRVYALLFAAALASTTMPLLAQQDQNRDRDQNQAQDQDQNRDRDQDQAQDRAKDKDKDRDRDRAQDGDRDRDRMSGDESAYYGSPYYKRGWQDGLHHKHKTRNWKNDDDRRAYEAGYAHGDRGEAWHNPGRGDRDDHDRR